MAERSHSPSSAAALLDEGIRVTQACLSLPLFLPSSVRVANVPVHFCAVSFKGLKVLIKWSSTCRATPARVPTRVLGNVPPWEQRTGTQDLFCLLGSFPAEVGEKGGEFRVSLT